MIEWAYFPRTRPISALGTKVVRVFKSVEKMIDSAGNDHLIDVSYKDAASNAVLSHVRAGLEAIGFKVEVGKKSADKISVPVLFGRNGAPAKSFHADAYHAQEGFVLEVEAGRAVTNFQFLKDLFGATVMVEVNYLGIAVRNVYKKARDFETVHSFLDTLHASERLKLPLSGILLIGY